MQTSGRRRGPEVKLEGDGIISACIENGEKTKTLITGQQSVPKQANRQISQVGEG